MTRGQLTSELLSDLAGFDAVEDTEVHRLLNEADRELCVRSGWTRANVELGPTVADQEAYTLPDSVYRPLKVKVDGRPYKPADETIVDEIKKGYLRQVKPVWWLSFDEDGVEAVSVYPAPSAGLDLTALSVVYPDPMADDDDATPTAPEDYHRALGDYAASIIYGYSEDNPDLREYHRARFEEAVIRLRQHRRSRRGKGDVYMAIEGVTR